MLFLRVVGLISLNSMIVFDRFIVLIQNLVIHKIYNSESEFFRSWVLLWFLHGTFFWNIDQTVEILLNLLVLIIILHIAQIYFKNEVHEVSHFIKPINKIFFLKWVWCNLCINWFVLFNIVLGHLRSFILIMIGMEKRWEVI